MRNKSIECTRGFKSVQLQQKNVCQHTNYSFFFLITFNRSNFSRKILSLLMTSALTAYTKMGGKNKRFKINIRNVYLSICNFGEKNTKSVF